MKVFTAKGFEGHKGTGTAVVVAHDINEAWKLLAQEIDNNYLPDVDWSRTNVRELDLTQARAIILSDGDY